MPELSSGALPAKSQPAVEQVLVGFEAQSTLLLRGGAGIGFKRSQGFTKYL